MVKVPFKVYYPALFARPVEESLPQDKGSQPWSLRKHVWFALIKPKSQALRPEPAGSPEILRLNLCNTTLHLHTMPLKQSQECNWPLFIFVIEEYSLATLATSFCKCSNQRRAPSFFEAFWAGSRRAMTSERALKDYSIGSHTKLCGRVWPWNCALTQATPVDCCLLSAMHLGPCPEAKLYRCHDVNFKARVQECPLLPAWSCSPWALNRSVGSCGKIMSLSRVMEPGRPWTLTIAL